MKTPNIFSKSANRKIKAPPENKGKRIGLSNTSRRSREELDGKEAAQTLLGLGIFDQAFIDRNGLK